MGAAIAAVLVSTAAGAASLEPSDQTAFDQALAATCDKSVVILGAASKGDGHGDTMKVALVEQLVSRCSFNGVLFEASYYEFLPIAREARQGKPVVAAQVASAVGAPWKFDGEVQPLFDFLAPQVGAGNIQVGGLDFQAGGLEQPYSNEAMIAELTAALPPGRRDACGRLYRSRIRGDAPPPGLTERARDDALKACLASIQLQPANPSLSSRDKSEQSAALANLKAWLDAGSQPGPIFVRARDAMMTTNALRFFDALPKPAKVVIWTHNGHAARHTAALPDYGDNDNLGQALGRRFGNALFSLAISARGGEYRGCGGSDIPVPTPPPHSLESPSNPDKAAESTFIGSRALKDAGERPSAVYGHDYRSARWGDAFDGMLVLDSEYPPHGNRP